MDKQPRKGRKRGQALDTTYTKQLKLDNFLVPKSSLSPSPPGSSATNTKPQRQVARKRTSHPPPRRPQDEERHTVTGNTLAPSPPTLPPASVSLSGKKDMVVRVKPARPHTHINYKMSMARLCKEVDLGEKNVVEWCQKNGLLLKKRKCDECDLPCMLEYRSEGEGLPRWICRRISHRKRFVETIAKGTIFEKSHLGLGKLLIFFYYFAHGITEYEHLERGTSSLKLPDIPEDREMTMEERIAANRDKAVAIRTSSATICDWLSFCREVCFVAVDKLFEDEGQIGGPGITVEIDESKFGKRKLHSGRRVDGSWVLGMIEINTGEAGLKRRGGRFRLEICPDNVRNEATLTALIRKHVKPGTTLVTDGWKAYCKISDYNYEHYTVIHDYNFVDPMTGANTQTVESHWRAIKRRLLRGGIRKDDLPLYLCEFLWRREAYRIEFDPFMQFIKDAGETYNPHQIASSSSANPQRL